VNYIIVSGLLSGILLILVLVSFLKYRKVDYSKYDSEFSASKLLFIGEYLVEKVTKGIVYRIEGKKYKKYYDNYQKLYSSREADELAKVHFYAKYSLMTIVFLSFMILSFLTSVKTYKEFIKESEALEVVVDRPEYMDESITKEYVVKIENDGQTYEEKVQVVIPDKEPTLEQITENIVKVKERLYTEVLNGNESFDAVTDNLELYKKDDLYGASLIWEVSDESIMTNKGRIRLENLKEEITDLVLNVTIEIKDSTENVEIPIKIIKANPIAMNELLERDLNIALAEEGERNDEVYRLPDNFVSQNEDLNISWDVYKEEVSFDNSLLLIFLGVLLSILFFRVVDSKLDEKLTNKKNQMQLQFPIFADKFILLYSCGISPVESVKMYLTSNRKSDGKLNYFDKELQYMLEEIEIGGAALDDAFLKFGKRSRVPDILKFSTLVAQDINRGDKNLSETISNLISDAWAERKKLVLELGNQASTKLLLPMMIMLLMVIIIVITPAVNTFSKF
jgi:hypothetical protein